jgi:hypothetical protein
MSLLEKIKKIFSKDANGDGKVDVQDVVSNVQELAKDTDIQNAASEAVNFIKEKVKGEEK